MEDGSSASKRRREPENDLDNHEVKVQRCKATSLAEADVGLLLEKFCSQLDEVSRQLEDAKARAVSNLARTQIPSLHSVRDHTDSLRPDEQVRVLELSEERARKKQAASGTNSVIVLDSDAEHAEMGDENEMEDVNGSEGSAQHLTGGKEAADPTPSTEDDELVFVSSTGNLGGDLPHPRDLCPKHQFRAGDIDNAADVEAFNLLRCEQCYCFLCDVSSKECRRWSGSSWLSHCNAHAGNKLCKDLRAIFRVGLASCPPSFDKALGLDARQVKSAHECMLQIQKAFDLYQKGQEVMAWDERRRSMSTVKEHVLHLGAPLVPIASKLGVSLDTRLLKQGALKVRHEKLSLRDVTALLCECLYCLATVLGNRYTRGGLHDTHATVEAAKNQYHRCVHEISLMLTVALLIIAMHGSVPAPTGEASWSAVREAVSQQLHGYFRRTRDAAERLPGEMSEEALEAELKAPLRVVSHSTFSAADLSSEGCRAEVRQALLAGGSHEQLDQFVSSIATPADLDHSLVAGLVQRGLLDTACDALLACDVPVKKAYLYDLWEQVIAQSPDAGMRLALRGACSNRPIHRPESERFNPVLSARCAMLRKALGELRKHHKPGEAAAWQQVWAGDHRVPVREGSQEFFERITSIRDKARQALDAAGCLDEHRMKEVHQLSRRSCLSLCPDGTLSSPQGRLLFFEVARALVPSFIIHPCGLPLWKHLHRHLKHVLLRARVHLCCNPALAFPDRGPDKLRLSMTQVCIEVFSRIHAPVPLCTELQRMADFLSAEPYSLLSLINSLHPKPACLGGPVRQRRRDVLQHILRHFKKLTANERAQSTTDIGLGLGGWVEHEHVSVDDSSLKLTVALDADCLAELRQDDLQGTTTVTAAVSRFVLRQAQEGAVDEALAQARRLLQIANGKPADKKGVGPAQSSVFWASLFQLAPFCAPDSLRSDLAHSCFLHAPCAASSVSLVLSPPQQQSLLEARKYVEAGFGLSSAAWPLGFGSLAILGFRESCLSALGVACRRLAKGIILSECTEIVRCLGPLALDPSALPGDSQGVSWLAKILEVIAQNIRGCRGLLEMEVMTLKSILRVGAKIEPAMILPILRQQADAVMTKILNECSRKQPAQRWAEIRECFVEWLSALKETYHTRPAVVTEEIRHRWESIRFLHAQMAWPHITPPRDGASKGVYRVRGPSLSSEWDSLVADIKARVGRKANIWRDVKAAGIAH